MQQKFEKGLMYSTKLSYSVNRQIQQTDYCTICVYINGIKNTALELSYCLNWDEE